MAKKKVIPREEQARIDRIFETLRAVYGDARCTLEYKSPFQLLIMAILSAQCTDARVNRVSPDLFRRFPGPGEFACAPRGAIEKAIYSCGFYNQKGKCIRAACKKLLAEHEGRVPGAREALLQLPGVGRKIANAVLGECFDVPGVIVDTHCKRVANRLGLTREQHPAGIEQDLMRLWPESLWTLYSHCLVFHGRAVCVARSPKCGICQVSHCCPWRGKHTPADGGDQGT